jgi:tryptophan-rich sensory protein
MAMTVAENTENRALRSRSALAFAGGVLLIGLLAAWIGFLLTDTSQPVTALPSLLPLPPWFFWMVWIVIYPALGLAAWHIWRARGVPGQRTAMLYFVVYLILNASFVPLVALIPGIWTAFLLDVVGLVGAIVLALLFRRVAPASVFWLVPLLIWLPITTLNKVPAILEVLRAGA